MRVTLMGAGFDVDQLAMGSVSSARYRSWLDKVKEAWCLHGGSHLEASHASAMRIAWPAEVALPMPVRPAHPT